MPEDYERTKETTQWQAGEVYNTDDLLKPVHDTDVNIYLDNRQVGQRRRWQRVHRVQDKIAQKQMSKELPMEETKVTKAKEWLQKLEKKEKGDSLDEKWGKAALAAGGLATYYTGMTGPIIRGTGTFLRNVPVVKEVVDAGQWVGGLPGRGARAVGRGIDSGIRSYARGYENVLGGLASAKAAAASTVPDLGSASAVSSFVGHSALGYSIGGLIGLLTRAIAHRKYSINKEKLKNIMHIPRTTDPEDVSGALDWFGFHHQAGIIRSGQGDSIIALENILRALNGDKNYINPMTGGQMLIKEKTPMFSMGKKVALVADLVSNLQSAHQYIKDMKFSYMIQERFKFETPDDYYNTHKNINEAALTIALVSLLASLGFLQVAKVQSLLGGIDTKVKRLIGVSTEKEATKLIGQIVNSFDLGFGNEVIKGKADPLLALELVLDYLEGNPRTRNPKNGYKISTPTKVVATIPFGASNAAFELLGYIDEVNSLIKKLKSQR